MSQVWQVAAQGGLVVREAPELQSKEFDTKLSSDAFVEELEVTNECLHYQLLAGSGPECGWVNLKLDDQELLRCIIKARQESLDECRPPFFCAWYSGGFSPKDGEKLLAPLIEAVRDVGLKDAAIFHFPDAYGMTDEGREPWASYIDLLIEEIDKIAGSSRPLILFGHSRGAAPATCVAYRQPERVRKVYIAACGAMQLGEATGWELLSHSFKQGGDRELLKWFSSLQPQNILLHRTAHETSDAEFEEQVQSSKFLSDMLQLMRCQYRDAMYPDPARDFGEMEVSIMAFSPLLDPSCQPEHCKDWGRLTNDFQLQTVNAGHMDCLQVQGVEMHRTLQNFAQVQAKQRGEGVCELFARICKDLLQFL